MLNFFKKKNKNIANNSIDPVSLTDLLGKAMFSRADK